MKQAGILVTGGAGYIGCHVVKVLKEAGVANIIVLDNLSTGFESSVSGVKFILGSIQDNELLTKIFTEHHIETVMHFAASTIIPDSLTDPIHYYRNNTLGTLNLLNACVKSHVKYFIFSSTAAVYGASCASLINEESPTLPINPYGYSKLMSEQIVKDVASAHHLQFAILRYFNVAGADPSLEFGQRTPKATHLIKVAVQAACGISPHLPIFGTDYPTQDGTCVRDFIHVNDLADAHLQSLAYLKQTQQSLVLNCGYGVGFSVKQVIQSVEQIIQRPLNVIYAPKRNGDPPQVVADVSRIKNLLGWRPKFNDLTFIVRTALDFEKKIST